MQTTWFLLWGLLWAVFFMTDGFDLGIGTLYPFLGKDEMDKKKMIHSMGPLWDGNEVWLITAGGVTFAAFPKVYATMFSSMYSALMLILFALILRGVAMEFRNKMDDNRWHLVWDICIFIGSFAPAVLFGAAFANIFMGLPIDENGISHGSFFHLLNPYGLLGGVLFLLLFLVHGALWLAVKTTDQLHDRSVATAKALWPVLVIAAVAFLVSSAYTTKLYVNYLNHPVLFLIIAIAVAALLATRYYIAKARDLAAWVASCVTIVGCTFFGVVGLYPNLFPSSINPEYNLTAFNASSSPLTLKIMLIVVVILIPVVIAYQAWAYKLFYTKVTDEEIAMEEGY